jgi:stearoyl-CoA desaturase (delta-9 desaturase)
MSHAAGAGEIDIVPLEEDEENHATEANPAQSNVLARPAGTRPALTVWGYSIAVVGFHLLLPLAFVPWLFSWTGLLLIPLGNYLFCSLGIGAGFHRLLTHRSFRCKLWFEHVLAILGVCSLQDSPARWVMVHRLHHQHSDQESDPHSPLVNFFWGHMGWLLIVNRPLRKLEMYDRYARDVLRDPFYLRLERNRLWIWVYVVHAALFYVAGLLIGWATTGTLMGGVQFGLSILLYGVVFRTIFTWHVTWGVNSASHRWGYRNYETDENSRNNWLFALATNGDGWHNNHHADPRCAAHGFHRWWELDVTYLSLRCLSLFGLVWDIVPRRREMVR